MNAARRLALARRARGHCGWLRRQRPTADPGRWSAAPGRGRITGPRLQEGPPLRHGPRPSLRRRELPRHGRLRRRPAPCPGAVRGDHRRRLAPGPAAGPLRRGSRQGGRAGGRAPTCSTPPASRRSASSRRAPRSRRSGVEPDGSLDGELSGTLSLHGQRHPLAVRVHATREGEAWRCAGLGPVQAERLRHRAVQRVPGRGRGPRRDPGGVRPGAGSGRGEGRPGVRPPSAAGGLGARRRTGDETRRTLERWRPCTVAWPGRARRVLGQHGRPAAARLAEGPGPGTGRRPARPGRAGHVRRAGEFHGECLQGRRGLLPLLRRAATPRAPAPASTARTGASGSPSPPTA